MKSFRNTWDDKKPLLTCRQLAILIFQIINACPASFCSGQKQLNNRALSKYIIIGAGDIIFSKWEEAKCSSKREKNKLLKVKKKSVFPLTPYTWYYSPPWISNGASLIRYKTLMQLYFDLWNKDEWRFIL